MRHLLLCYFSLLFISRSTFAVYDLASINIIPSNTGTSLCFSLDTGRVGFKKMYLALTENNTDFSFIFPASTGEASLTPWEQNVEPPLFTERIKDIEPSLNCFGPFDNSTLQNLKLYAGVGASFDDIVQNQKYRQFFNGFTTLPKDEKQWTVMVYVVGSDLETKSRHGSKDFLEMLQGTSQAPDNTHLIITTGGSTRNGWQTLKRTFIQNGQQYVLEDLGAKSMAEPETLSDFVIWAKANFPAQHYALILWNHGNGSDGFGYDTSEVGKNDMMTLPELHQAYQTIRQEFEQPLDIVVYDACLMASIEVAEITASLANAMAGSAELEPGHGIDYTHLLTHLGTTPPDNGLDFGRLVKTGYIQHTKDKKTFDRSQITYSVFDLTQLASFTDTFKDFALEFKQVLAKKAFLNYERLSRGIIRAPGYPFKKSGRLRSLEKNHIRIDLSSVLRTVGPDFPEFKAHADQLLLILDQMVVDYEGNIGEIDPNAGRVSLDIGEDSSYLTVLPEAYTLLKEGLAVYNRQKQNDTLEIEGDLVPYDCPLGIICADAPNWLELEADDVLNVEAYLGQKSAELSNIYLIKSLYQHRGEVSTDLEFGINGNQACQYQICVNEAQCENITLTEQRGQLLADISLNDNPAVLSFCQEGETWTACSVVQQTEGIWGRDDDLYPEDSVIPSTLHVQDDKIEQRNGNPLLVDELTPVTLKKTCRLSDANILAVYYGLNGQRQFNSLCVGETCENAGVYIKP
jgi:hypothetical protein